MNYKKDSDSFFQTANRLKKEADTYVKMSDRETDTHIKLVYEEKARRYLELVSYNLNMASYNLNMTNYEKLERLENDLKDLRTSIETKNSIDNF